MDKHYKDYIQIGLNIMRYRKEQGLTQDQLSEMAGYSRNHLQRVETAVCKPTVGLLLDVSEVLGVPVERLMEMRRASASGRRFLHPHLRLLRLLLLLFRNWLVQRAEVRAVDHAVGCDLRAVLLEDVFCVGFAVQMLIDQVCILAAENEFQLITHQRVLIAYFCLETVLRQFFNAVEDIVQRLTLRRTDHSFEFCKLPISF